MVDGWFDEKGYAKIYVRSSVEVARVTPSYKKESDRTPLKYTVSFTNSDDEHTFDVLDNAIAFAENK